MFWYAEYTEFWYAEYALVSRVCAGMQSIQTIYQYAEYVFGC